MTQDVAQEFAMIILFGGLAFVALGGRIMTLDRRIQKLEAASRGGSEQREAMK